MADLVLILDKTESYWVGREYIVWSTTGNMKPHITTWIYNDPEGNIIFHITPVLKNIFTISKKKFDILYTIEIVYKQNQKKILNGLCK